MATPHLSFLIPAYDCEDVIDEAIESALAQELPCDFEIVIVDDASSDSTNARAQAWVDRHPERVRLGAHPRNRGGAATRNTAAGLAQADLLYILDSDNVLARGCVASQMELMRTTELDAVSVGQIYYFEASTDDILDGWVQRQAAGVSTVRHLFESIKVPAAHGNYLYTRRLFDAVGGYPEEAGAMDTWTFGLSHLARGYSIGIDPHSHYFHRLNRPGRESYWSREERRGTNDVNAIAAVKASIDLLPEDLQTLTAALRRNDRFFSLVSAGAFASDLGHFRDVRRVERAQRAAHVALQRALALAAGARTRLTAR